MAGAVDPAMPPPMIAISVYFIENPDSKPPFAPEKGKKGSAWGQGTGGGGPRGELFDKTRVK
jgi:hypothetical protein